MHCSHGNRGLSGTCVRDGIPEVTHGIAKAVFSSAILIERIMRLFVAFHISPELWAQIGLETVNGNIVIELDLGGMMLELSD